MTKRLCATGLLALLLVSWTASAVHAAPRPAVRTVVLILAPYLRWDDVLSGDMPQTARLAKEGAAANMNVRSLLPDAGEPSAEEGALMISAGTWARHDEAAAVATGSGGGTPAISYAGLAADERANAGEDADIRLGTLGEAVVRAGGVTAAIGNGDGGGRRSRPAALVAMDASGDVTYGDVSPRVTRPSASSEAPLGVISDGPAIVAELDAVLAEGAGRDAPALVVIDPGDLERARRAAGEHPEDLRRLDRRGAVQALDALVGSVRSRLPAGAVLVIAAPVAAPAQGEPPGFGPLVVSGEGWSGCLTSASTHRDAIVTSADLTAGILTMLGIDPPVQVAGSPLRARPADVAETLPDLQHADAFMRAVDGARGSVVNGFILLAAVVLAACLALLVATSTPPGAVDVAQLALLALASVPVATLLMYLPLYLPQTPSLAVVLLAGTSAVVFLVAVVTHHTRGRPKALSVLTLFTGLVILIDQWSGAPLSLDGLFSYSPLVGARYYGIGNETAALLVGAVLTGAALVFDTFEAGSRWIPGVRRLALPVVGLLCVLTAAAPFLGANIGVTVWGLVAFGLAWWGMLGRKVTWRSALALLLAVVLVVVALVGADLLAGGPRTHLGRSVVTAMRGGPGQLVTIVARKAATNGRVLVSTSWSLLFLALAAVLAYLRWRPRGSFRDTLVERPNFAATLTAVIVAGVVAYLTEDSGIVVPALLLFFPTLGVVYLLLWRRAAGGDGA